MSNLITSGSSRSVKHPIFWIGLIGLLLSFYGFFKIGNFAFSLIKDQSPITSMAQNANLKLSAKDAGKWLNEGIDVLDNLVNRRSNKSDKKNTEKVEQEVKEVVVEEQVADENYSGASFVFASIFIFMLLKLVLSIVTMIFRESLDMIK